MIFRALRDFASLYMAFCLAVVANDVQSATPKPRQFSPGSLSAPGELPLSRVRTRLEHMPRPARDRAMAWLNSFHFTDLDLQSLQIDSQGGVFYADAFQGDPVQESAEAPIVSSAAVPVSPFPQALVFHSRPGAPNVLYLDCDGENVTGTAWNTELGRAAIPAVAFSTDADYSTFSDADQVAIKRIWERVAEDYAPFNVDVTTERPATFGTRTGHALLTRNTDANEQVNPADSAGGVAYVNVFATSSYASHRPAWIYCNNLSAVVSYIAEAASHELGHNMGLSHDGTSSQSYYGGHGTGDTSWGPIMGTGYGRNVSQWSKGDYYLANNLQDDLFIISGKLAYVSDDHTSAIASATALNVTSGTNILATTPESDPGKTNLYNKGIIDRTTDVDVFSFTTGSGPVTLAIKPWLSASGTRGGNLDISVELLSEAGILLLSNNPPTTTSATVGTNLAEGMYYLRVRNSGAGTPAVSSPTGYTDYGSLGQYFITGTITDPEAQVTPESVRLDVCAAPAEWGVASPAGGGAFLLGDTVEAAATPSPYFYFQAWTGTVLSSDNPVSLVLTNDVSLVANFAEVMTTNYPTPHWWLASNGYTTDFERVVTNVTANGYPLWQSYIAGLRPTDATNRLTLGIQRMAQNSVLTWGTVTGRVYTILQSTNLADGYTPVPGAVNLPATSNTITNPASGGGVARFYRVQVDKP